MSRVSMSLHLPWSFHCKDENKWNFGLFLALGLNNSELNFPTKLAVCNRSQANTRYWWKCDIVDKIADLPDWLDHVLSTQILFQNQLLIPNSQIAPQDLYQDKTAFWTWYFAYHTRKYFETNMNLSFGLKSVYSAAYGLQLVTVHASVTWYIKQACHSSSIQCLLCSADMPDRVVILWWLGYVRLSLA